MVEKSSLRIVHKVDQKIWCEFVDEQSQGNIFHTPEMFKVFERTKGCRPKLWACVGDDERLLALLLPIEITLKGGLLRRLTTRSIAYGSGLCTSNTAGNEALVLLLSVYIKDTSNNAIFTELRNLSDLSAHQLALNQCGFIYEDHLNYLISVNRPVDEIWQAISKGCRKSIRRSISRGVIAEEIKDRSLLPVFYGLLQQTYARAKIPLVDISFFEAVFDILIPKGMAKMLLACVDGNYVAASLEMPYKDIIYSLYSGYDWNWRSVYPNDRLVWYILEWGANNRYSIYDFGGAGKPDESYGVRDFKAKYGGNLVNFGRNMYIHSPVILTISRIGYEIYRQMIRFSKPVRMP